jgi:hypothetical protein
MTSHFDVCHDAVDNGVWHAILETPTHVGHRPCQYATLGHSQYDHSVVFCFSSSPSTTNDVDDDDDDNDTDNDIIIIIVVVVVLLLVIIILLLLILILFIIMAIST